MGNGPILFFEWELAMSENLDENILEIGKCPSRMVIEMLADKWKLMVLHSLNLKPVMRNGELIRALKGVSQKMLTQTLRSLERDGLIERRDFKEIPPRVEYSLTPLGQSLCNVVTQISEWGVAHFSKVESARTSYDNEQSAFTA